MERNRQKNIPALIFMVILSIAAIYLMRIYMGTLPKYKEAEENQIYMLLKFRGMSSKFSTYSTYNTEGRIVHIGHIHNGKDLFRGYKSKDYECFKVRELIYRSDETTKIQKEFILADFVKYPLTECNTEYKYISSKTSVAVTYGGISITLEDMKPRIEIPIDQKTYKKTRSILETGKALCIRVEILDGKIYRIKSADDIDKVTLGKRLCDE